MTSARDIWHGMDTGQKVSGVAHIGLIVWVMVFDIFQAPDRNSAIPVTDVSIISSEEFAALSGPRPEPEPTPAPAPAPEPAPPPVVEAPAPEPEIRAPEPVQPEPQPEPQPAPEPEPQPEPVAPSTGVIFSPTPAPGVEERPRPRPVDRVAPTPSDTPPEGAQVDIAAQPAAQPDAEAETQLPEEEQAETAPPEATTEIVTEATETDDGATERAAMAPTISSRPRTRPERPTPPPPAQTAEAPPAPTPPAPTPAPSPAPTPAPEPEPEPAPQPQSDPTDAIAEALAAALSQQQPTTSAPASGGLSSSEADGLRLAIQQCWNIGVLSTDAQQVTVTVAFSMTPSARHEQGSIRIVSASGGTETAIQQAFDAARRAIIRCEGDGYGLPADKYDAWRDIEITFNPEGMRLR